MNNLLGDGDKWSLKRGSHFGECDVTPIFWVSWRTFFFQHAYYVKLRQVCFVESTKYFKKKSIKVDKTSKSSTVLKYTGL